MSGINGKQIDCSALRAGTVVKDYKTLCGLLGETVRSGNQKIYQLRNWERFFGFERLGRGYRITELRDVPCDLCAEKKPKSGKWLGLIEPVLLGELVMNGGYIDTTNTELIVTLGMAKMEFLRLNGYGNKNCGLFVTTDDDLYKWSVCGGDGKTKVNSVTGAQLSYFGNSACMKAYSVVGAGLSALSERGVIEMTDEYKIGMTMDRGSGLRSADDREIAQINEMEQKAAEAVGCSALGKVIGRGLYDEYRRVFSNMAVVEHGWSLTLHNRVIAVGRAANTDRVPCEKELERLRVSLNRQFIGALLDKARNDKARFTQSEFGDVRNKNAAWKKAVGSRDFIGSQKRLADYLIKI